MNRIFEAPEAIETERLLLRRPELNDAPSIFSRYAGDPDVTPYLGWPRHRSVDDSRAFVEFSDMEWSRAPAGPLLILDRHSGTLLGSTGLAFESPDVAATGYVLAKDSWGRGFATEAVLAMVDLGGRLGLRRLYALCHAEHRGSWRVLEKCGFDREQLLPKHTVFPNLDADNPLDTLLYGRLFESG